MTLTPPDMSKVPGGWLTNETVPLIGCKALPVSEYLTTDVVLVKGFMNPASVDAINQMMTKAPGMAPVSVQGMQDITNDTIGSWRTTMYNVEMAQGLKNLFRYVDFQRARIMTDYDSTDWWQNGKHRNWEYVGVSPMLRYMKYKSGGRHAVHYDAGYVFPNDEARTLMSFVLYLSTNKTGATRIIDDGQQSMPIWNRNHADWDKDATEDIIVTKSLPVKGNVLLFDHRVPHDVEFYDGAEGDRIIIRGDLIFKKA